MDSELHARARALYGQRSTRAPVRRSTAGIYLGIVAGAICLAAVALGAWPAAVTAGCTAGLLAGWIVRDRIANVLLGVALLAPAAGQARQFAPPSPDASGWAHCSGRRAHVDLIVGEPRGGAPLTMRLDRVEHVHSCPSPWRWYDVRYLVGPYRWPGGPGGPPAELSLMRGDSWLWVDPLRMAVVEGSALGAELHVPVEIVGHYLYVQALVIESTWPWRPNPHRYTLSWAWQVRIR